MEDTERKHRNGRHRTETSQWKTQNGNIAMEDTENRTKTSQRLQNGNIALKDIKQKHHNEDTERNPRSARIRTETHHNGS